MHNLMGADTINNKFALVNSGEYLMHIENVEEILQACKLYLKTWKQIDVEKYNNDLYEQRIKESQDIIKNKRRISDQKQARENRRYVYIILNKRSGLFKIGISINPIKRERTLQGEEPEVEIIETFKGGYKLEKHIHRHFENKRIRGEWFSLDENDIIFIKENLIHSIDAAPHT